MVINKIFNKILKLKWENILLIFTLILAIFFRFWNYQYRYGIGYDGSRDALVALEAIRQIQLPATGSFSSIGPITFGPWYYYFNILSYIFIPSPWAPWIGIGIASIGMVIVMYQIGVVLKNSNLGLLFALLTTLSPAQISSSTNLQQHALIGFISSLVIYLLIKLEKNTFSFKLFTLWGFILGVSILIHYQSASLLTLPFLFFISNRRVKSVFSFLKGLIISFIPTLFFELNNHWFNTKNIIDYIRFGQFRVWTSNRWLTYAGKFWPHFWSHVIGTPLIVTYFIMLFSLILLSYLFLRKRMNRSLLIICLSFITEVILLRYYRGEKFFGYLQFFHPYLYIFTGLTFYALRKVIKNNYLFYLLLISISFLILQNSFKSIVYEPLNIETRGRIEVLKKSIKENEYSTYYCTKVYDKDRVQALLLFLQMNNMYNKNGHKVAILNPSCHYPNSKTIGKDLVDVNNASEAALLAEEIKPLTSKDVYEEVVRWWFEEKP